LGESFESFLSVGLLAFEPPFGALEPASAVRRDVACLRLWWRVDAGVEGSAPVVVAAGPLAAGARQELRRLGQARQQRQPHGDHRGGRPVRPRPPARLQGLEVLGQDADPEAGLGHAGGGVAQAVTIP